MHKEQMISRCPSSRYIGLGTLHDYELFFAGRTDRAVASVRPRPGVDVPIVIWEVSENDIYGSLDYYEGYPRLYDRAEIEIEDESGEIILGLIYVMTDRYAKIDGLPTKLYYTIIEEAYHNLGLPLYPLKNALKNSRQNFIAMKIEELKDFQKRGLYNFCPSCGHELDKHPAISRKCNVEICSNCGIREALEDLISEKRPLSDWHYFKK